MPPGALSCCTGRSDGTHRICDLAFEPYVCQAQLGLRPYESLHGIPSQGFNVNNSNDQKPATNEAVGQKAIDEKKVTSPQTDASKKVEPGDDQDPAKNAQSPAQSSR
jgi:hypothetical protein